MSERDIVLGMTVHGARLHDTPIVALIQREVISCGPEDDLRQVMAIMTHRRVRHVPVVVGQRLCGLISIGDVVKQRLGEVELEVNVLRDYARIHSSVP